MSFGELIQTVWGTQGKYLLFAVSFIIFAFILGGIVPKRRARLINAVLLFLLSIFGLCVSVSFLYYGYEENSAALRWTKWATFLLAGMGVVNVLGVFVFDIGLKRFNIPRILRDLITGFAYVAVAVALLTRVGVDFTGIIATSAVLTAVIGFSLQDTLVNVFGGIALEMENQIKIGDWIRFDKHEGRVKEIRWRQTSIETRDWDTLVIPNNLLIKEQFLILGKRTGSARQHRMWVHFNVDFRYSPSEVIEAVETALRSESIPNVAQNPPINCVVFDFKDSYINYAVRYWLTDLALDDPTNSVVRTRIYTALKRAGISLSIPAQTVFFSEDNSERRQQKLEKDIAHRMEILQQVELFQSLTEDERRELAEHLSVAPFARGEAMTRQGAEAHWLYVITKGEAEVRVSVDGTGLSKQVATLKAGDFFGEMGMMTGTKRSATVIATVDTECFRIDKESFQNIISSRPEIAEDISHILANRLVLLDTVREGLNEEAAKKRIQSTQTDFLKRIRNFFRI
ncbi:MAG TPA: mechanosensitive ion channel family protein [Pyrinomonadaceae bacterium]|jgi:small-conductance mechanosensitive channel/CRP-like cAMP-binding protein